MKNKTDISCGIFHWGKIVLLSIVLQSFSLAEAFSQQRDLEVGIRLQKTLNLYYENGISVQYSDEQILPKQIYIGFSYITSRLGSALGSNALKQDNFLISSTYYFRYGKSFQPFLRLNTGYFHVDLEEEMFSALPSGSILLSPEGGVSFLSRSPVKIGISMGYNIITGDGLSGPGTLYPLFFQTTIAYNVFN